MAEGKLDPVVGREKENVLFEILNTKNNPLLGEPGLENPLLQEGLACESYKRKCQESCLTSALLL
jgi:ATP-dependent Clp protease ATP-binding subunit ClpA